VNKHDVLFSATVKVLEGISGKSVLFPHPSVVLSCPTVPSSFVTAGHGGGSEDEHLVRWPEQVYPCLFLIFMVILGLDHFSNLVYSVAMSAKAEVFKKRKRKKL